MRERDRVRVAPPPRRQIRTEAPPELEERVAERDAGERVSAPHGGVADLGEPGIVGATNKPVQRGDSAAVVEILREERLAELVGERALDHVHEPRLVDRGRRRVRAKRAVPPAHDGLGLAPQVGAWRRCEQRVAETRDR